MLLAILATSCPKPAWCMLAERAQSEPSRADQAKPGQATEVADWPNPHQSRQAETVAVTGEQLSKWIRQLDDDQYLKREAAQQNLLATGEPALAMVSAVAASTSASLESATRTVRILTTWSNSKEPSLRLAALESLALLDNHPAAAAMASEVLAVLHEQLAIESIERLGGQCSPAGITMIGNTNIRAIDRNQSPLRVTIGSRWKGTDDDLKLICKIRRTYVVSLHSAPVGDQALTHLTGIKNLKRVEIYGNPFSPTALDSLRKALPDKVYVRSAAKLGIQGDEAEGGSRIIGVQKGTAADKAGLRPYDIIIQLDGKKVENFQSLTQLIAAHQPGDTVMLTVVRGRGIVGGKAQKGKQMAIPVTFDRWGSTGEDSRPRKE
jgi:PDZ domain-containing protein